MWSGWSEKKSDEPLQWKNYCEKVYTTHVGDVEYLEFEHFLKN